MNLLKNVRQRLVQQLWTNYLHSTPQAAIIAAALQAHGGQPMLDHWAMIDLPSAHSGIGVLTQICGALGFMPQGHGYLPEKQNEFLWMAENDAIDQSATQALPQAVIADFTLDTLPSTLRNIVHKYTCHIPQPPLRDLQRLSGQAYLGDENAADALLQQVLNYIYQRQWPLPSRAEVHAVQEANELLAWVLVFGHIPNHFALATHLLPHFNSFTDFIAFITQQLQLPLNLNGGAIKGACNQGIEQGSTLGEMVTVALADGELPLRSCFVEFVWRHAKMDNPLLWKDFYTGFIAHNANQVIESLAVA